MNNKLSLMVMNVVNTAGEKITCVSGFCVMTLFAFTSASGQTPPFNLLFGLCF